MQLAGIGYGNDQSGVVGFQRHEVITKHQLCRDTAEKIGIDALLAKIDEGAPVSLGETLGRVALSPVVQDANGYRIIARCCHKSLAPRT